MWDDDLTEETIEEGNIVDIISHDGVKRNAEIVKVHCFVCGETFIGPKDRSGMFISGHKEFHMWEITLHETLGGL